MGTRLVVRVLRWQIFADDAVAHAIQDRLAESG